MCQILTETSSLGSKNSQNLRRIDRYTGRNSGFLTRFSKGGSRCVWLKTVDSKPHQAADMDDWKTQNDQTRGAEHPHLMFSDRWNDWIILYRSKMLRVFDSKSQLSSSYSQALGLHTREQHQGADIKLQARKVLGTCSVSHFSRDQPAEVISDYFVI